MISTLRRDRERRRGKMRILPDRSWWLTPSGGPYSRPWSLKTIMLEAPLPAHLLGGAVLGVIGLVVRVLFHASLLTIFGLAMLYALARQDGLVDAKAYPWGREPFWRIIITASGTAMTLAPPGLTGAAVVVLLAIIMSLIAEAV
jgi:hypothetical protein